MSVFGRVADILQAKTHKLLNQLEDPNETLDLSYEKMISGLQETKLHLADVVAQQKSLERQIAAAGQEAAKAENDARLALQVNREDLAKAALSHKHSALEKLESLEAAHAAILPQAGKLIEYEKKLEDRIERFRTQKEIMKASYTAAAAQVRVDAVDGRPRRQFQQCQRHVAPGGRQGDGDARQGRRDGKPYRIRCAV